MTTRRNLLTGAAAAGALAALPAAAAPPAEAALGRAFDGIVDRYLEIYPEQATSYGLDKGARARLKAKLTDGSAVSRDADHALCLNGLKALSQVPDAQLSPASRTSKAIVGYFLELGRDGRHFDFGNNTTSVETPHVVDQQNGAIFSVPEFLDTQHQVHDAADADAFVARVHAFAKNIDAETERMRHDANQGVIPPNFLLANAIGQQKGFLAMPPGKARLLVSLRGKLKAAQLPEGSADTVQIALEKEVYPAADRQRAALELALAKADDRAGVWRLRDGEAYYAWCLKAGTTTDMSPEDVHQLGLSQNAEIDARMDTVLRAQGLTQGSTGERMTALRKDPKILFPDSAEGRRELVDYLNQTIAVTRGRMGEISALKLQAPVVVRPVPTDIQDGAALGYMSPGSIDGSRPSIYYINLKSMANWPKFGLPDLTYHETLPGHVWQLAYLTETGKLPLIRTIFSGFNAYVEGWALYAEQLADETGFYKDDALGQLGYLQGLKFRAVRLVVDTGLHAKRWTRNQAIDWAVANSGRTPEAMTSEIDRYCSWPGQACGYKVGHTAIVQLRERAKAALGARFDLRAFNDAVVETGPAPIAVLGNAVRRRLSFEG